MYGVMELGLRCGRIILHNGLTPHLPLSLIHYSDYAHVPNRKKSLNYISFLYSQLSYDSYLLVELYEHFSED